MAESGDNSITTTCPRCGRTLTAASLDELSRLAAKCCKSKAKRKPTERPLGRPLTVELPYTLKLEIQLKSGNQFQWAHWTRYAGYKKQWFAAVQSAGLALAGLHLDFSRWAIVRHYDGRQKEWDHGNLVAGAKPAPDALKHIGAIRDDAPKYFSCEYRQERGGTHTDIILLEGRHDSPPIQV
jgi:hypothetical protein